MLKKKMSLPSVGSKIIGEHWKTQGCKECNNISQKKKREKCNQKETMSPSSNTGIDIKDYKVTC